MSYSVAINLWFEEESVDNCLSVLTAISRIQSEQGDESSAFSQVKLFDEPLSKVAEFKPAKEGLDEICSYLKQQWSRIGYASIESSYPFLDYEDEFDSVVELRRPLDVKFYRTSYVQGHYQKRFGHVEITFDSINSFLVPHKLIVKAAETDTAESLMKRKLMIAQISNNYQYVRNIIKAVIADARPIHLLSCTESDVNPLVAHDIYHSRLEDFCNDLLKIAKLHEYGGMYFCDVQPGTPEFLPAWKQQAYGYWRGRYGRNNSDELVARLQPYVAQVLRNSHPIKIPTETIEKCLASALDAVAEPIGEGYLVSSRGGSMDYIEEPYFCLFQSLSH